MDGRFFGVPRSSHRPTYYYSVPVQRQTTMKSPKVVSIPVHFVESVPTRTGLRSESAEKIQAAFRGFMVRKYVRMIDRVRREVEEIERRFGDKEMVELLRIDKKERLKLNEELMSLLFRLDSVRGVDFGVRELRKKVIKKAITLQEKVDTIAASADFTDRKEGGTDEVEQTKVGVGSPDSPDQEGDSAEDELIEEHVADLSDREEGGCTAVRSEEPVLDLHGKKKERDVEADQSKVQIADVADQKEGCGQTEESEDRDIDSPDQEEGGAEAKQKEDQVSNGSSGGLDHAVDNVNDDACHLLMEKEPAAFETSTYGESGTDPSLNLESFPEEVDENTPIKEDNEPEEAELFEREVEESAEKNGGVGKDKNACDGKHNIRSEEMLGRMMEDNEKMMGMMAQLFERNEQQTQLLSLMSQRVERLEKAFLCEKLRRKKKMEATRGKGC